jgi:hypothetical protein
VQIVPADPFGVAVVPAAPAPAYNAYAYAPGHNAYAYAPGYNAYAYAPGHTYTPRTATTYIARVPIAPVPERRYVVQQTPSLALAQQPAYVMVERTYAVERPAVVVERPARRVATRRTVVRTVDVPVYPTVTAVPTYRNPVYDQDIRAEYVRPISCAIDAFGVERCY